MTDASSDTQIDGNALPYTVTAGTSATVTTNITNASNYGISSGKTVDVVMILDTGIAYAFTTLVS